MTLFSFSLAFVQITKMQIHLKSSELGFLILENLYHMTYFILRNTLERFAYYILSTTKYDKILLLFIAFYKYIFIEILDFLKSFP